NLRGTKLLDHGIEIPNAKLNHPVLIGIAEVVAVVRKGSEDRRSCFLRPGLLIVISRHEIDAKLFLIPLAQRGWIFCAKEQASNSSNVLHRLAFMRTKLCFCG